MTDNLEKISDDKVNKLNSRQKLRDVKKIIKSKELNYEDEKLQKTFKRLFKSNLENLNLEDKNRNPYHKAHGEIRSYFSSKFLRENKDWLR